MTTRVAMVLDRDFASRERRMIVRQRSALAEEDVRLITSVPDDAPELVGEFVEGEGAGVTYRPLGLPLTRPRRAEELARALEIERHGLDAVLACGAYALPVATELASQTGAAMLIMAHRLGQLRGCRRAIESLRGRSDALLLAPSRGYERAALSAGIAPGSMRLVPWGVCALEERDDRENGRHDPDRVRSVVIAGSGHDRRAMETALRGVAEGALTRERVLLLIDAHAARRAELWKVIRELHIESITSLVPLMQGQRDLVLNADMLLLPEALGTHITLTLDAIARGVRLICTKDPAVDWHNDERLARVLSSPSAHDWALAVGESIDDPAGCGRESAAARDAVRASNRATAFTAELLRVFEWACRREGVRAKFAAETAT